MCIHAKDNCDFSKYIYVQNADFSILCSYVRRFLYQKKPMSELNIILEPL